MTVEERLQKKVQHELKTTGNLNATRDKVFFEAFALIAKGYTIKEIRWSIDDAIIDFLEEK
jgi:hypothetical protein